MSRHKLKSDMAIKRVKREPDTSKPPTAINMMLGADGCPCYKGNPCKHIDYCADTGYKCSEFTKYAYVDIPKPGRRNNGRS